MSIVTILWTDRGAERAVDGNGYQYYFNRKTEHVKYWLCAQKGCNARMSTRISSSNLVGPNWPTHEHGTNILKKKAKEIQQEAIKKFSSIPGTSTKMMMGALPRRCSIQPIPMQSMACLLAVLCGGPRKRKSPLLPSQRATVILCRRRFRKISARQQMERNFSS